MNKRDFLKKSALLGLSSLIDFTAMGRTTDSFNDIAEEKQDAEAFWDTVRRDYELKKEYINLENGYYNIQPVPILEKYAAHTREVNLHGAYYMRTMQEENKRRVTEKLAALAGCDADEIIITRNTTESLDMVIAGLDWQKGDEAIMAEQDYGAMLNMFGQVSKRHSVVNKVVSIPVNPKDDEEIVDVYRKAIGPKTKLLMVCHMINITGQILPVRKICDMAQSKGVMVLVDGAHTFAHIDFKIKELNCDFYGCSLHKWLSAPMGAGMLYVKKGHAGKVWPLLAEDDRREDDITRLNHTGTHPVATDLTISDAIDYYLHIGPARKEERLRYLQRYWTGQVRDLPNVILYTPGDPQRACAIATAGIKGMRPADMADKLFREYKIYTVGIDKAGVSGCRITPNVFTTIAELDTLVQALKEMSG